MKDISKQNEFVLYLQNLDGIRRVNYSNSAAAGLSSFNTMVGILSVVIIGVLLAVSVFLISNTINVAAAFRKSENEIMRYIGATNYMIRAPFVVEGMVIGLLGAIIPLSFMSYIYQQCIGFVAEKFQILSGIIQFQPLWEAGGYFPCRRLRVTVSPPTPQLSVSTSSMTTTVVAGFFPKTRTSSFVAPLMSSSFCSAVGVPFSRVTLILT